MDKTHRHTADTAIVFPMSAQRGVGRLGTLVDDAVRLSFAEEYLGLASRWSDYYTNGRCHHHRQAEAEGTTSMMLWVRASSRCSAKTKSRSGSSGRAALVTGSHREGYYDGECSGLKLLRKNGERKTRKYVNLTKIQKREG